MPEIKSPVKSVPLSPQAPTPPTAGTPPNPDPTFNSPLTETVKAASASTGKDDTAIAMPTPAVEIKPIVVPAEPIKKSTQPKFLWVMLFIFFLLILVFLVTRPRQENGPKNVSIQSQSAGDNEKLSNYSAFVAKNKSLKEEKYSEKILTDEPYAGQAPMAAKASGPLVSSEIDPQLAALADALKKRVQILQGSQLLVRNNSTTKITKGDFRGFKINALEKLENGVVFFDEISIGTPKNGFIKAVNHVLESVQKTDFSLILSEIQNAGLEFSPLPELTDKKVFRGQLRVVRYWGKPIPSELLISEKSVGSITLGMPVALIKSKLAPSYGVLKRKVLVNDKYCDVYKVADQGNEPLFYIYEKEGKIWGISVISEIFKTARGIGIGSNLDAMLLYYPHIKLVSSKKKPFFVQLEGVDGIFIIQNEGDKKAISILIGESPEFE